MQIDPAIYDQPEMAASEAPWPELRDLAEFRTGIRTPSQTREVEQATRDSLDARIAGLRARAEAMSAPVLTAADRQRLSGATRR